MGPGTLTESPAAVALRIYVGAFVEEMVRAGVTDVCVCPGSRSTPLALVMRRQPGLRLWMHLDERSASYFALGMAKAQRRPVAVLATSGTATLNFAPAVAEAHNACVPLIVLTADRPPELREVGATQTVDQVRMYGGHAKWSVEMLLPETGDTAVRYVRAIAARAVATARGRPWGPVHLNFPFREPLMPAAPLPVLDAAEVKVDGSSRDDETPAPHIVVVPGSSGPWRRERTDLGARMKAAVRGVIVCGALEEPQFTETVKALSAATGYPILADLLSQVRCEVPASSPVIDCAEAILRTPSLAEKLAPELILRFGATPVSRAMSTLLEAREGAYQVLIAEEGTWPDPQLSADVVVRVSAALGCAYLAREAHQAVVDLEEREAWLKSWRNANQVARNALDAAFEGETEMSEPLACRRLADLLPDDAIVFAGNSMPVRDLDSFVPSRWEHGRFLANRGASGIDGVVSTALGIAAATEKPTVLVIGDVSLYHDLNGLLAAKRYGDRLNLTIVLLNNDGGGIFNFLSQTEEPEHFEELFGTPHGLDFRHAAAMYGIDHTIARTPAEYDAAVRASLKRNGVRIVEVRTERVANVALHAALWRKTREALEAAG